MASTIDREAFLSHVPAVYRDLHDELLERLAAFDWIEMTRASGDHRYAVRLKELGSVILEVGGREGQSDDPVSRVRHDIGTRWNDLPPELEKTYRRLWADYVVNTKTKRGTLIKGGLAGIGVEKVMQILESFRSSLSVG